MKGGGGSMMILAVISWYSAGPIITLNGQIAASDCVNILGNQVHPSVQVLPNNDAIFQDHKTLKRTARSFQSWFEEHEDALQHLPWSAQSPDLNIIEPLWSVLDSRLRTYLYQWEVESVGSLSGDKVPKQDRQENTGV
jgi:hypothetical protein